MPNPAFFLGPLVWGKIIAYNIQMGNLSSDVKKQLLGQLGQNTILYRLVATGWKGWGNKDNYHPSIDLFAIPATTIGIPDDLSKIMKIQIKCKVPWVTERAQSFTQNQLDHYLDCDRIYFICVPLKGRYEELDQWKGNIYYAKPREIVTRTKTTKDGRPMTLIDLEQPALHFDTTIHDSMVLTQMRDLTTMD
jgi:hypothetical protein